MKPSTPANRMPKLVMFTPANTKSAIGRMAALVTRSLSAMGCGITVVRTEGSHLLDTQTHDYGAPIVRWDDATKVRSIVDESDACVYQIGNNYDFHQGGVHWLASHPGMVCLHDFFLGHLFYEWAQTRRSHADIILSAWYGHQASDKFFGHANSESFIIGTFTAMPMTEWICSQANAVITHSQWGCKRVLHSCPGPVRVVPLAYDTAGTSAAHSSISQSKINPSPWRLLTIGHINSNKRVESVIKALGNSLLLREKLSYQLVGAIQPSTRASLSKLANELGVSLIISGEVDDTVLARAIQESDAISCLRWPALEAASASAIEAMLHGKAVVVTDTGFYRELPSDCTIKINPNNEIFELQTALERLVSDPAICATLGNTAKEWATKTFTASNYASQLVETIFDMTCSTPAIKAIEFLSRRQLDWSVRDCSPAINSIQSTLGIFSRHTPDDA